MREITEKPVRGTVVCEEGKYLLKIGDEIHELPVGPLADLEQLDALVDHEVHVVTTVPTQHILALFPLDTAQIRPKWVCYIDPDVFINARELVIVSDKQIENLINKAVAAGRLTEENGKLALTEISGG